MVLRQLPGGKFGHLCWWFGGEFDGKVFLLFEILVGTINEELSFLLFVVLVVDVVFFLSSICFEAVFFTLYQLLDRSAGCFHWWICCWEVL